MMMMQEVVDTGIRAALFSTFPEEFVGRTVKRLEEYGVFVERVFNPERHRPAFTKCNCILFMHEMASQGDIDRVKRLAEQNGLPFIRLTRHHGKWPELFKPVVKKLVGDAERLERVKKPEVTLLKGIAKAQAPAAPVEEAEEVQGAEIENPDLILSGEIQFPPSATLIRVERPVTPPSEPEIPAAPPSAPASTANLSADEKEYLRLVEDENVQLRAKLAAAQKELAMLRPAADALHALTVLKRFMREGEALAEAAE